MVSNDDIDETILHAYVDRQLDPQLQQAVLNAMQGDARIRERVGELRMTKDWTRAGFSDGTATTVARARHRGVFAGTVRDGTNRIVVHPDQSQP